MSNSVPHYPFVLLIIFAAFGLIWADSISLYTSEFFWLLLPSVMITYNIYIVIRETVQFSSKGIINDFIGNLNRLTVSRRFTEQAV